MKFLVDAQLPLRLARFLQASGYDTLHTRDLLQQNATPDAQSNQVSMQQERIVMTKDSDFVDSFMTVQQPYKLFLISTGNIKNQELEEVIAKNLQTLVDVSSTEKNGPSPQPLSRWERGLKTLVFHCSSLALREREVGRVRASNSRWLSYFNNMTTLS